ncbi:MAG: sugar ABC transporter substrate-binding protein [Lachnospiraceae bacterium]|nr:sugar ABC transporter substrate-binding protein [Lachnospiraceae bacterium]
MMRVIWKKLMIFVLAVTLLGSMLMGCDSKEVKKNVIGVSLPSKELARCLKDEEYLRANLEKMGYEVDVQFAQGDANIQVSQVENMITNGVSGLIISPWDGSSMTNAVKLAHENGIPVIAYDALILGSEYIDYYSADDLVKIGATQAQYIVDKLDVANGKGPFNIEIVAGDPADSNAPYFYNGAMDILKPYIENGSLVVPSGQIEFTVVGTPGWDGAKAQSRMDAILSTYYTDKTLDAVLCSNDGVALGTISALKSVGYGSKDLPLPITTGQDCDIASIKSILAGEQSMTVFKDISILAKNASYIIDCLVKGEVPEIENGTVFNNKVKDVKAMVVDPKPLDKDNCKELLFDSGYYKEDMLN